MSHLAQNQMATPDLAIEMNGVGKTYRYFALENISLQVPKGEIMGLIGPNGAGKSTTIRILLGLVHQDRGDVRVLGHPMPAGQVAAKWDIGFASEDMRLYEGQTLEWHMRFMRSIYPNWDSSYAQLLLKRFGLRAEQKLKGISHGQRVKSTLLLVLARKPKLLVLDEPTTGLDPVARHEILRELTEVMVDEGRSVLFSSHNTQDVEQISDRITFIDRGRIIDSMDKETYLDRWRRLRLEVPLGVALPPLPGIVGVRQEGRLAIATANAFVPELATAYEATGARVQRIESMTLEEIFVANVEHSREQVEV
jgi:ABC-2 type transport system ATP-binding protein